MSVRSHHVAHHAANNIGFPNIGGTPKKTGTEGTKPKKRLSAEERAEKARLDEPYGNDGSRRSEGAQGRTRVVRRRVRRRRVGTQQTQQQYGSSKAQQAQQAQQKGKAGKAQGQNGPNQTSSQQHMMRKMNSQSNLNQMTAQFRSGQAGSPSGPQTPVGKKMAMLGNLQNYMKNDYAAMKANDQDTAFTYRTSEARQLVATLGSMVASTTKQGSKKDTKKSGGESKGLSPEAFSRQKGLLRRLKAMSDPSGPMPEGLPVDYKPFESVA
jgi:hypothetical protein